MKKRSVQLGLALKSQSLNHICWARQLASRDKWNPGHSKTSGTKIEGNLNHANRVLSSVKQECCKEPMEDKCYGIEIRCSVAGLRLYINCFIYLKVPACADSKFHVRMWTKFMKLKVLFLLHVEEKKEERERKKNTTKR